MFAFLTGVKTLLEVSYWDLTLFTKLYRLGNNDGILIFKSIIDVEVTWWLHHRIGPYTTRISFLLNVVRFSRLQRRTHQVGIHHGDERNVPVVPE